MLLKNLNRNIAMERSSDLSDMTGQSKFVRTKSRSKSIKLSRSKSNTSLDSGHPAFYIKRVSKVHSKDALEESEQSTIPSARVLRQKISNQKQIQKKRQPTPSKSYRQLNSKIQGNLKNKQIVIDIEKEMQIHDLEKKIASEKKIRDIYEKKAKQFENESSTQARRVKCLQSELKETKRRQAEAQIRIRELENYLETNDIDLRNTKSKLQKLKVTIKQNRSQQFLIQIKQLKENLNKVEKDYSTTKVQLDRLRNQNISLKMELERVKYSNEQSRIKALEQSKSQILRRQISRLKGLLQKSKSETQRFFQEKVHQLETEIIGLKAINKRNLIQINFLNRKKHEEFEILKKQKGKQLKNLRIKYNGLMDEYKKLQNTIKRQRIQQNAKNYKKKSTQKRGNRFLTTHNQLNHQLSSRNSSSDEHISFELSPEFK